MLDAADLLSPRTSDCCCRAEVRVFFRPESVCVAATRAVDTCFLAPEFLARSSAA